MEFVAIQSFNNYVEAHITMGRLQQQHINCWLKDEYTVTIDPILTNAIGGIKLMVAKVQAGRALDILQTIANESRLHYACPQCSSHNIQLVTTPRKAVNWLSALATWLLGSYAIGVRQVWHCFACGHETTAPLETHQATTEALEE